MFFAVLKTMLLMHVIIKISSSPRLVGIVAVGMMGMKYINH
jgi:hypothetical protein